MEPIRVQATRREQVGKSVTRRLRDGAHIPAVAYGKGLATLALTVAPADVIKVIKSEYGTNALIELDIDGKDKMTSLLREYQCHPVSRHLLHADFVRIEEGQMLDLEIPLELTGKSKGVTEGGVLEIVFRKIPVRCLPKDIPVKLSADITELDIEDSLPASAMTLPTGVTLRIPAEQTIVAVEGRPAEEEEAAAAAAAAPGAAAPGAAPAAGAAPGAPAAAGAAAAAPPADAKKAEGKKEGKK